MKIKDSPQVITELLKYNNQSGQSFPCSNQIVTNIIICLYNDEYVQNFLDSKSAIVVHTRNKKPYNVIINGLEWKIINCADWARGYRAYRIYIDGRLDWQEARPFLGHMMNLYCCEVDIF